MCVTMQRDEDVCLPAWLAYHGHMFGYENLVVLDNGSKKPSVLQVLEGARNKGVTVHSCPKRNDFLEKHLLFGRVAEEYKKSYDFIMPLDVDEFVVRSVQRGFTTDRDTVRAAFLPHIESKAPLRIKYQIANHPTLHDHYQWFEFHKSFFRAGTFKSICHGFHNGATHETAELRMTDLCHVHLHNWPWSDMRERAKRKWMGEGDIEDTARRVDEGEKYDGPNSHLLHLFCGTEDNWHRRLEMRPYWHFPQFRALLAQLGTPLAIPLGSSNNTPTEGYSDAGLLQTTPLLLRQFFDSAAYLERNPDLKNIDPVVHFMRFGYQEGRGIK
jgi:hypothetical protein